MNNNNFDRIEAFLFGMLNDSELEAFENDLRQDSALQAALALHQREHRAMELALRDDLQKNLQTWKTEKVHQMADSEPSIQVSFVRRNLFRIAAAASIVLIIGYFSRTLFQPNSVSIDEYYQESSYAARSWDDPSVPDVLKPGLQSMESGNYADAISKFTIIEDPSYMFKARLFAGECHYKMTNYKAAITVLTDALRLAGNKSERETAEWHLLLNHLKANNDQVSNQLLNKISGDAGHEFYLEAQKLR